MVSPKGAVGIMQMMPDTAKDYGITDRCDPEQSIRGGIRFLKRSLWRSSTITSCLLLEPTTLVVLGFTTIAAFRFGTRPRSTW